MRPKPSKLIQKANAEPERPEPACLSDYAVAIRVLRKKNMTWKDIQTWLADNGLSYSTNQIMNVAKVKK